jgi:chromosome segregation ATPase
MDNDDRMDADIAQLNERLSSLEGDFAVQVEIAAVERASYASKEEIARVEALLVNCATKQDIARIDAVLATVRADIARIDGNIARVDADVAVIKRDVARLEASVMTMKVDMARMDAVLDGIQKNYATTADLLQLEARLAQMETRLVRWMFGTFLALIGISCSVVFGVIKLT